MRTVEHRRFKAANTGDDRVHYRAGGNPPEAAGLWHKGRRIVWWPAGVDPTAERVENIFRIWEARQGESQEPVTLGRETVMAELKETALL